jgi:hypothetical protein
MIVEVFWGSVVNQVYHANAGLISYPNPPLWSRQGHKSICRARDSIVKAKSGGAAFLVLPVFQMQYTHALFQFVTITSTVIQHILPTILGTASHIVLPLIH